MSTEATAKVLMLSFHKWGKTGRHSITYKNTNKKSFRLLEDFLKSDDRRISKHNGPNFHLWISIHNIDYSIRKAGKNNIPQEDIGRMLELGCKFFAHREKVAEQKELDNVRIRESQENGRQAEARS